MPAHRSRQTRPSTHSTSLSSICCDVDKLVDTLPLYRASHDSSRIKLKHSDETLPQQQSSTGRTSHTRKLPVGHIPRPRNGFMVFRSDLCASEKITSSVENHHGEISQVAGYIWRSLSKDRKAFYMNKAEEEKVQHARRYPNYKFSPAQRRGDAVKRRKKSDDGNTDNRHSKLVAEVLAQGNSGKQLEKAINKVNVKKHRPSSKLTITIPPRASIKKSGNKPVPRHSHKLKASSKTSRTTSTLKPKSATKELRSLKLDDVAEKASINFKRRLRSITVESEDEEEDEIVDEWEEYEDDHEHEHEHEADAGIINPPLLSPLEDVMAKFEYPFRRDGTIDPSAIFSPDVPSNYPVTNEYLSRHLRAPSSRSSSPPEDRMNDFIGYCHDKSSGPKTDPFMNEFGFDFSTVDKGGKSFDASEKSTFMMAELDSHEDDEEFLSQYYED